MIEVAEKDGGDVRLFPIAGGEWPSNRRGEVKVERLTYDIVAVENGFL